MLRKPFFFGLLVAVLNAQEIPVYELEEYTVVAPSLRMPATTIHQDAMRSAKPMDLAAILSSELPAAALSRRGPLAGDLVLRGLSRDNVLITVDNNKTYCACPNRMDPPAFHVSSQQVESVEVRTGPFSVDGGASIGGHVAVSTKSPDNEDASEVYGYAGSFDYRAGGFSGGWQVSERNRLAAGLHHQRGGVFKDGDGARFTELAGTNYLDDRRGEDAFRVTTLEAKLEHELNPETSLKLNFGYQDASDVLYPGLRMDAPKDRMHRGAIELQKEAKLDWADYWEAGLAFSGVDHLMDD
ncbi:MAG TPA: TonB-dependent receptor plug domain-containing protein, partial [Opitutales bacterium]|nr:TonB-dependent receptor plug domain-containing protein [Opitutales bacterium]